MAWARMGSATGLAWAAAMGAAPRMMRPIAQAAATERMLAAASDRGAAAARSRLAQPPAGTAALAGSAAGAGARGRAREPAAAGSALGVMLLGAGPSPPNTPTSSINTPAARHNTGNAM